VPRLRSEPLLRAVPVEVKRFSCAFRMSDREVRQGTVDEIVR